MQFFGFYVCDFHELAHADMSRFVLPSRAFSLKTRSRTIPATKVNREINCEVDNAPTLPLARSPLKNSSTNLPAL